jgi:hypothetical protein
LDVEVFDLVGGLVGGYDVQELSEGVSFEVFFGEVFQVSFGECDIGFDDNFFIVGVNFD